MAPRAATPSRSRPQSLLFSRGAGPARATVAINMRPQCASMPTLRRFQPAPAAATFGPIPDGEVHWLPLRSVRTPMAKPQYIIPFPRSLLTAATMLPKREKPVSFQFPLFAACRCCRRYADAHSTITMPFPGGCMRLYLCEKRSEDKGRVPGESGTDFSVAPSLQDRLM